MKKENNDESSSSNEKEGPLTNESLETYKSMRHGLLQSLQSGLTLPDHLKPVTDPRTGKQAHGAQQLMHGPPSSSLSSLVQWRRLDPSETIVLSQATLLRVNELLQQELLKRQTQQTGTEGQKSSQHGIIISDICSDSTDEDGKLNLTAKPVEEAN